MSGRDDKAKRYISLLDSARCNGSWAELPELIRKCTKHAPQRKGLLQTAQCESEAAKLAVAINRSPSSTTNSSVTECIQELATLLKIDDDSNPSAEQIQMQTCLAWLYWLNQRPGQAAETLRADYVLLLSQYTGDGRNNASWTLHCLVKAAYIKGASLIETQNAEHALREWRAILPWLDDNEAGTRVSVQLSYWLEQLLAQLALVCVDNCKEASFDASFIAAALQAFRHWSAISSRTREVPATAYGNSLAHLSRYKVWRQYYTFLSRLIQGRMEYPSDAVTVPRSFQFHEFRRVEELYESEFLTRTQFPRATETNEPVEQWVEVVVQNWQTLCSDLLWTGELGDGARNSYCRNVLDILYRAAGKTFHSTLILRRLFQVHMSVADFGLAFKALDTYIELIERGCARAAKSKEAAMSQDDDETVLRTVAEGIEGLCAFGGKDEAEKAFNLSQKLSEWLSPLLTDSNHEASVNDHVNADMNGRSENRALLPPAAVEHVYRAIGIAQAQWAHWTPLSERRQSLQADALASLWSAVEESASDDEFIRSTYALALLLADTRDVDRAVILVKECLVLHAEHNPNPSPVAEKRFVPMWHLLGLLLTAQQDFSAAAQVCRVSYGLEGFGPIASNDSISVSEKNNTTWRRPTDSSNLPLQEAECDELQRLVEVHITDLAITELLEGPEDAVNNSNDLLTLYSCLFGRLGLAATEKTSTKTLEPLHRSDTTEKSHRGNIFGSKKLSSPSNTKVEDRKITGTDHVKDQSSIARPSTNGTEAPTIQVTDEDGGSPIHKHHHFRKSGGGQPNQQHTPKFHRKRGSISKMMVPHSAAGSNEKERYAPASPRQTGGAPMDQNSNLVEKVPSGLSETSQISPGTGTLRPLHTTDDVPVPSTSLTARSSPEAIRGTAQPQLRVAADKPEGSFSAGVLDSSSSPKPPNLQGHAYVDMPRPRFPRLVQQKHSLALLAKIWLVIATLYRRAHMFEDAREACDEAAKCAARIESHVASIESSARAFADPGWGCSGKSSDELWADVYCERGQLASTIAYSEEEKGGKSPLIGHEKVAEAVENFEQCLMFFPNHAKGIVGLCKILLDFSERKVELGNRIDDGRARATKRGGKEMKAAVSVMATPILNGTAVESTSDLNVATTTNGNVRHSTTPSNPAQSDPENLLKKTPENLNRLAARDRAYGLLSTITKLGSGWDNSEAWYELARAHELGGESEKAKEILWWCVELEDRRPIRHWSNVTGGKGYVL